MKICILIPVHNEAKAIGALVKSIRIKGLDVFVVDDGSTDGSGSLAQQEGAHVLSDHQQHGKGYALQKGFQHILSKGYDGVITMDGDGQHAVEDIDSFVEAAEAHPRSIINGNRMHGHKDMPAVRLWTNRLMSSLISLACRQSIPDTQCGYRFVHTDILKEIRLKTSAFQIETEMLMKASKKGFKIYSVPVQTIYRGEQSKISPIKDSIRFIIYFIKEVLNLD